MNTRHLAICADPPDHLRKMVERSSLDPGIVFLSDPDLLTADRKNIPVSRRHPQSKTYPKNAFLQPSVFIYDREQQERFSWRIRPRLTNMFGASRRMSADDILKQVVQLDQTRNS